jgi:hypothetical protein
MALARLCEGLGRLGPAFAGITSRGGKDNTTILQLDIQEIPRGHIEVGQNWRRQ